MNVPKWRVWLMGFSLVCVPLSVFSAAELKPTEVGAVAEQRTPIGVNKDGGHAKAIGGDFSLTDHMGRPFRLSQLKGKVVVLFFGFTHCAVICPDSLAKMAKVLEALDKQQADQVQALFISVDPERDTVAKLARYVPFFSESILGLTGTPKAISEVATQYNAHFTLSKTGSSDQNYTVDHSADIYVLNRQGKVAGIVPFGMPAAHIQQVVEGVLGGAPVTEQLGADPDTGTDTELKSAAQKKSPDVYEKLLGLKDLSGNSIDPENYHGKPLLINYWATWCPPCRAELPALNRAWKVLQPEGFAMLAVNVGEKKTAVQPFLEDYPIDFPVFLDEPGESMSAWEIRGMPMTLLLDAEGQVIFRVAGERKWDNPAILKKIRELKTL